MIYLKKCVEGLKGAFKKISEKFKKVFQKELTKEE